jgi:putative endonuclease
VRRFHVYILASRSRQLYVGVTGDLLRRLQQHRQASAGFTARYRVDRLVYVEAAVRAADAIRREKQLKGWRRDRKLALIESVNPAWDDLMPG